MEDNNNPKQELWSKLNQAGYYTKDFSEFEAKYSTPESISSLYGKLNGAGYFTKSEDEFNSKYFSQPKGEEPVGGATSGQDSNAPTQPSSSSVKELTARAVSGDEAARQELTSLKSTTQSQPFDVDSEISKAKDKLDNLSAQSQRDGWTKEQFAEYSRPVVEHIKGLENLKGVSPEDIQQKKKAENLNVAGLRETALSNPKLKMTADYYESAQRQFADESKFDLNIVGTHEKYTGKAPSQNIQERKLQDNQAWDKHKENMKRLELRLEDAKKKIEPIVDPLVDSEVTGDNYSKFIMKGNSGVSVKNTDAIYRKADELVAKITNGSESSFLRKDIVNKISAAVDYKILEPDAKIYADSKVKELNKKFGIDNDSPESIFQKESLEIGKIADGISNKVSAEAKEASDAVNNAYSSSIKQLQASADQYSAQMKIKQDQLVQAAQSGQINQLQYEAGINALNEEYKAGIEDIKSKGPSYDEYIKSINEINTRANRKYQDEIENAKKISTSKLEEKVKSIYGSEEYSNELKAIWGESFDKSQQKRFSDMKETEKIKELQILIGEGSFFQNSLTAVLPRFTSQTATSFGNAMKGFGVTLNNQALQEWGAYVGSKYEGSPVSTKAKDLLDPSNFAALSGQLLGGMAPSLAAGAVTAVATEGAGLGTAAQLVSSALAGFTTETAQIAGDAWDRMYQKTGSAADADEAYRKSINSQIDIAWAYAFDGLPFVKGALSKIESKAARVLAGSGIEFLTELIQEYPQNIAEENIMKQLDPWAGLSEKLTDVNKISETAVTLAPVALLGGAGQVGSKSRSQEIADAIIARESKASLSGVIEDQMDQYVQNITFAEGDKRARTVVAALMTAGHINESGLQRLNQVIDRSVQHNESAQKAGLNSSQRAVYSFFSSRADQATANAELYADDPIMSKMFRDQAKEYESAASDFLSNKPSDFYTVTYKDGTKIMLTSADAAKAFNDSTFLTQLADNKISVASYGKDTKIMDDLEAKAQVQKETNIKNKFNSIRAIWNKMDDISFSSNYDEKTRKQAKKQANALWKEMNKIKSSNPKINFYDTQNQPGVRGAERERETPIETQPNQGASTEAAQTSGVVQEPQEVEDKIQEEFKANGLDRLFPLDIDESTDEGKQLAKEKLAQQQAQDDIRAKYNVKSPINQSQEAKTGSNVAEVGQKPAVLEEGSTTTLPPQIQGATPRTMVFKDGTWQQQVGGTTTRVSEGVQAQAQQAFDQENDRIAQEEAAQEEMAHATLEEEQNAAAERESRLEEIRSVASDLTPGQIEDAADFMAARDITASEAVRHIRKRMSAEEEQQLDATVETMRKSFESAGISVEFGSTDNFDRGQGTRLTEGVFLSDDGRIIIDKSKLSKEWAKTVVFHEGTHPIINIIRNTNPELYAKVVKAKSKLEKLGLASIAGVKAFSESSVDKESSKESQVFTEEDEFIVELIARVASGKININSIPSESRSIIAQIINGIAKMLGMKPVMMDSDIVALKKLASDISRVLSTGADIAEIVGEDNTGRYRVAMSERSGTFETGETVYSGQARVTDVAEEIENPYRKSVNLPVKSLIDLLEEYGDNVIVVNSDPTGLGTVTLPSGKKIHLDGGIGYMAIQENIDAEVGFASSSDARVKFLNKKAIELRDAGKLKNGKVLVLVMVQKADSMLGNNYTPDYVADALAKIPKNIVSKQELSALLQEPFSKSSLIKFFTNQKSITSKTKPEKIPQIEEQNQKNMAKGLAKIEKIKSEIAALDPRSAHDRMIEIFHELNFVQAQAYFADILGNYTNKTTKYNKKLAQLLYKYAGADQKSLFKLLGEKSLIDKMLENPQDWGYAVAAFVHDTEKQKEKLKGIKHNLFNAKFQGGKRYILDKAYRINDLMVEFNKEQDEKVKKGKKKGAVYAEQQTSQGMYAVGKANIPKSKGVEFESLKSTEKRYQASTNTREEFSSNADETIARLKNAKEEDGATLNLDGTTYDGGGLVVPAGSVNVPQGKISADGLYDFLRDNEDKISSDIFKIGLYKFPDRSEVSYDLNIVIPREHREVALEFGKLSGQESLFDLDTYENIKTGSDGKNPRQFSGKELASIAKDLSEGRMPSVVQKSQGTRESIEGTYYESNMTEDGGDYIFFHVSGADKKALSKGIDSTKFNSLRTSREEKGLQYGVASFYTKPNDGERMVGGEKYVVRVPKDKVYPMDLDPNGYREVAEKKFPADTPFRKANIDKAVADMAKKAGFQMIVGEWNYSRTGKKTDLPEFRADALVSLKPTGEKSSEFESNEDKGMERVPHPDEAVLKAKGKLKDVANDIADYLSSKGKYNDAYQVANHYRNYGEVIVNRFEDNEFTRDMTKEDFDVMTNKLPKSLQSKASGIRESLPSANTGQKSEGNRESSSQALMEEIDAIIEKKGVDATMARRQFKETYGNESYDRAVKITRNFNQIIEALENKGIVKKQCP